jgi:ABC-type amino acid transport substrate-binding protein
MVKSFIKIVILFLIISVCGCATTRNSTDAGESGRPLRVGVTPDYPPVVFKLNKEIVGVEADLARRLAKELNRPLQFIELKWDDQIPALLEGKTDIIMSGMSITEARKIRIDFTDYYFKSGLLALMRVEDARKYTSLKDIMQAQATVGMVKGTTGDVFVQRNFPNVTRISTLSKASDAPSELKNRRIDIFVNDAPSIIWLVSENEADLTAFWKPFNEEYIAWGIRRDDQQFLGLVNSILEKWKKDGTLKGVLTRWLPAQYMEHYEEAGTGRRISSP